MAGASASWRAPWFDTTTAAAPASMQRTASSARCTPLTTTGSELSPASHAMSSGVSAGSNSWVTTAMKPPSRALSVLSPAKFGSARSSGRCTPIRHSRRRSPDTGASTVRTRAP